MQTRRRLPILAGVALLAGLLTAGGTFALWDNTADVGEVTLTAGNLDISEISGPVWKETSADVDNPIDPVDPDKFLVRQGDTFTVTYDFTTELQGDNMLGELRVDWSDPAAIPSGVSGTYMLFNDDGDPLLDNDVDLGDEATLDQDDQRMPTDNTGRTDKFLLTVSLNFSDLADRFSSDDPMQTADLGTFDVELHQMREGQGFK